MKLIFLVKSVEAHDNWRRVRFSEDHELTSNVHVSEDLVLMMSPTLAAPYVPGQYVVIDIEVVHETPSPPLRGEAKPKC